MCHHLHRCTALVTLQRQGAGTKQLPAAQTCNRLTARQRLGDSFSSELHTFHGKPRVRRRTTAQCRPNCSGRDGVVCTAGSEPP